MKNFVYMPQTLHTHNLWLNEEIISLHNTPWAKETGKPKFEDRENFTFILNSEFFHFWWLAEKLSYFELPHTHTM